MEGLLNVQTDLYNSIKKAYLNYKKSPKERLTFEYIEARLENLEADWKSFRSNNSKLYEISDKAELLKNSYVTKEIYESTEDNYLLYKSALKTALKQFQSSSSQEKESKSSDKEGSSLARLPKITIPTFSGSYPDWTPFRDLFVSLVHNNKSLDNVQKLHYLKTHLAGEAGQLIKHTPITDGNYAECWSLLENRYNNKKYLANCILKRLFGQRRLTSESASGLKELLDTTTECLGALKNIDVDVTNWDIIIIHIVTFKLDLETRKQWEIHTNNYDSNELPTLEQLKGFMQSRFRALEFVDTKRTSGSQGGSSNVKANTFFASNTTLKCEYCSQNHKLCFCKKFAEQDVARRRDFVAKNSICFNCLGSNHSVNSCKKPTTCKICRRRHHSLLHNNVDNGTANSAANKEPVESTSPSTSTFPVVSCFSSEKVTRPRQVLLATALVNIESASGRNQTIRALLDQGSQACFITEAAAQLLHLKKTKISGKITGLGGGQAVTSKYVANIKLKSRIDTEFNLEIKAYVIKNITSHLPEKNISTGAIDWVNQDMVLADPECNIANKIDLLLGADVYSAILLEGVRRSPTTPGLVAQRTLLGWILSGTINCKSTSSNFMVMHTQIKEDDDSLKKFWEIEEQTFQSQKMWTEEEQKCENIFMETTKRTPDGRYVVQLPFRDDEPRCVGGNSRQIAVNNLKSLERRLSKEPNLKNSYTEVIKEYLELGHMRLVNKENSNEDKAVYLPHHAVVRNDKTTTKVRVVFNASSKNACNISLNDTLMIGPKLQPDLRHLVLRWRSYPIVLVADIVKMYRMVRIAEEHAIYQRIVWRDHPEEEIKDFELMTVTFGTASAPHLAVRSLNQVSVDEGSKFPVAGPLVSQSFYMDDLMTGCMNVKEGVQIYTQLTQLLSKGGFTLQKWNSNNEELLSYITVQNNKRTQDKNKEFIGQPLQGNKRIQDKNKGFTGQSYQDKGKQDNTKDILGQKYKDKKGKEINIKNKEQLQDNRDKEIEKEKEEEEKDIEIKDQNTTKVLGLTWNRREDYFQYSVNLPAPTTAPETKRSIISIIAKLYDPLGWIAPTVVLAKMMIQKLWLSGKGWDEPIPDELYKEWRTYFSELTKLTEVRVPRWIGTSSNEVNIELHGFSDASKAAYAAVVYFRVSHTEDHSQVSLLAAKTRVAPIKQVSIPRLELCGAVLLSQLLVELSEVYNIPKQNVKAWTDSTVVLAWLNSHPSKWKTFVANRVSTILTNSDASQWYYVASKSNPADLASRGIQPTSLAENEMWFSGPKFLREKIVPYRRPTDLKINLEESVSFHVTETIEDNIIEKYSSLQRLLRVVAYCRRFYKKNLHRTEYLSKEEIEQALICCIKITQKQEFTEEYEQLESDNTLKLKTSKLKSLCPYIDQKGVMRVCGRLQNSQQSEGFIHPIILPHSSHLTKLIIGNAHQVTLHGGVQLMVNYLRSNYWILRVKSSVRQHIRKCVTCVRQRAQVQTPFMGSLPSVRCSPARAFLNSGLDYFGPIRLRVSKGRGNHAYKGYVCVFICMFSKAIHLEAVSDMTTSAFLAAFRRFVSRRGHCAQLWSDNGTTFVGASKELQQLKAIQSSLAASLENNDTKWHFIPPYSPNWGGLWESAVKSTKFHIRRVIGESTLTFEEMSTLLSQIEACLNSRPLTVDNSQPGEPLPLTPGHFLIGGPLLAVPDYSYLESHVSSLSRWQLIQRMLQGFWHRWSQEYLSNMMNRYKWTSHVPEPNIGDVVLVKEEDLPPSRWMMGRIVLKHPGADNITRVVTLRVKNSTLKRPVSKLCILPVTD